MEVDAPYKGARKIKMTQLFTRRVCLVRGRVLWNPNPLHQALRLSDG